MITKKEFANILDMSALHETASIDEIDYMIDTAIRYHIHCIGCGKAYHPYIIQKLKEKGVYDEISVVGGGGWPTGHWMLDVKLFAIKKCMEIGDKEFDLMTNIGYIKSKMWDEYRDEIRQARELTKGYVLKAIINAPQLDDPEIVKASQICAEEGVDFIKTDTGKSPNPTTIHHVRLIKATVGDKCQIKAAGGVRTPEQVMEMMEAGVTRFGISYKNAVKILEELPE